MENSTQSQNFIQGQFDLRGKAAFTGDGTGIGRATALALAGAGAFAGVHYHSSAEGAKETLSQIKERGSDGALMQADLTVENEANQLVEILRRTPGVIETRHHNEKKGVSLSYVIRICCLMLFCSFTVLCADADEQVSQGGQKMFTGSEAEYLQDSKYIESFRSSKDLEGLKKAAKLIEMRWRHRNVDHYSALILDICQTMTTLHVTGSRTSELLPGYAMQALKEADRMPIDTEISLVLYLTPNVASSLIENKKAELRSSETKLWLHAWQRLQGEIIVGFDFTDFPLLNVSPPAGANVPAGIVPEAIQDPKLRAEYETAIEKNKQKAETYNKQYHLRKLHKIFAQQLEHYLIAAYTKLPYNTEELKQYLKLYVQDAAFESKILKEVNAAIQRNEQNEKGTNSTNATAPTDAK